MKFKHIRQVAGLAPHMKETATLTFDLKSPIPMQIVVTTQFPSGVEQSSPKNLCCICTTEGEILSVEMAERILEAIKNSPDGISLKFPNPSVELTKEFHAAIDTYFVPLKVATETILKLLRWRGGLSQSSVSSIISNKDHISPDGEHWFAVGAARSLLISLRREPEQLKPEIAAEVIAYYEKNIDEPLGHQLFQEA